MGSYFTEAESRQNEGSMVYGERSQERERVVIRETETLRERGRIIPFPGGAAENKATEDEIGEEKRTGREMTVVQSRGMRDQESIGQARIIAFPGNRAERSMRAAAGGDILVIAEKPSVGRSIAKVLGAEDKKEGYLEGNGYVVSWCIGHLVEPVEPEGYDESYGRWCYEDLPIIPDKWKYQVKGDTKKQYGILKELLNDRRFSSVVCATDAGREGETIFRKVYMLSGSRLPIKRLWISSMEESAIREGFENLRPGEEYENLYQAGICREKADWLVGMNGTRLFTTIYRYDTDRNLLEKPRVYRIGRVQTPTLAIVAERDENIRNFVKEPFYTVHILSNELDAVSRKYKTREEATELADKCLGGRCVVDSITEEEKSVAPPKLYDLTSLQRDANRLFGFTAKETLDYTQGLYEKKLCTYPRTDSKYLTDDMEATVERVIEAVRQSLFLIEGIYQPQIGRLLNSRKVSDHHAIIPTVEIASQDLNRLSEGERKVLAMLANRLICAAADKYLYRKVYILLNCNEYPFEASGTSIIDYGYKAYENMLKEMFGLKTEPGKTRAAGGSDINDEPDGRVETDIRRIDQLYEGMRIEPYELSVREGFTAPPKPFTEDTLLKVMENAGNKDFDEEVERKGLGTPATRAEIIDKLCRYGYLKREKKTLRTTEEGQRLIRLVPEMVKSVDLSVEWENKLALINRGELDPEIFMSEIKAMLLELVGSYKEEARQAEEERQSYSFTATHVGECPNCHGEIVKGKYGLYCKDKCGMKLDVAYGKHLTDEQVMALLKGESITVTLKSKKGKVFDAILTPKGIRQYEYKKDGKDYSGFAFDFDMEQRSFAP